MFLLEVYPGLKIKHINRYHKHLHVGYVKPLRFHTDILFIVFFWEGVIEVENFAFYSLSFEQRRALSLLFSSESLITVAVLTFMRYDKLVPTTFY